MPLKFNAYKKFVLVLLFWSITFSASAQVLCRFAVVGDVRPEKDSPDHVSANPAFLQMIGAVNLLSPDFVVMGGDYIYGGNPGILQQVTQTQWNGFEKAKKKFTVPVYLVAGNHDIWDQTSMDIYQKRFGNPQYGFDYKGAYFIVLNTYEKLNEPQIRWLGEQLKLAGNKPTFILLHIPFWWSGGRLHGQRVTTHPGDDFWAKKIHPLLVRAGNVQAVIASHEHMYVHQKFDGIDYIISGGGGAETRDAGGELTGSFHHFLMVAVQKEKAKTQISVLSLNGVNDANLMEPQQRYLMLDQLAQLRVWSEVDGGSPADVTQKIKLENPFPQVMEVGIFSVVDTKSNWKVSPDKASVKILPGKTADLEWHIKSDKVAAPSPTFLWQIRCGNRALSGEGKLWIH